MIAVSNFLSRNLQSMFWIVTLIAIVIAAWLIVQGDFRANIGFLILGALVAVVVTILGNALNRPIQIRDLARALHIELADRVARCCFDCEAPWNGYINPSTDVRGIMDSFRLRKFAPNPPVIYTSTAGQLAMLEGEAPQALIHFYYRLAAWQRDVENLAAEYEGKQGGISENEIRFLARRLHQTLAPGLRALEAFSPLVDGYEKIEAATINGYDEFCGRSPNEELLRSRIQKLLLATPKAYA